MKRIYTLIAAVMLSMTTFAQAPEKMSYQAVIRDGSNALITTSPIGMQISILQGSPTGAVIYSESQSQNTNSNGLVSLEIGTGSVISGDFSLIDWSVGTYYLKTETDPTGGANYTIVGTSQLMSVPYALYAKSSGSSTPGPQGPAGADGIDGIDGVDGAQGSTGPAGSNGSNGAPGAQGAVGPAGNNGTNGIDGAQGPQGAAGNNGTNGIDGVQGSQGLVGPAGSNGLNGVDGTDGQDGAPGNQGIQGIQGATGSAGANGADGQDGADGVGGVTTAGTNITMTGSGTVGSPYIVNGTGANLVLAQTALLSSWSGTGGNGTSGGTFSTNANQFIGVGSGFNNTLGIRNNGTGKDALYSNTEGSFNTASGYWSLYSSTEGNDNTATGYQSLKFNTTGNSNTANGMDALRANTIGYGNSATGSKALIGNSEGYHNTAVGYYTLSSNSTGDYNTSVGASSLYSNSTGSNNTALGRWAFYSGMTHSNSTAIGYNTGITASNQVRLGATTVTSIGGQVGWTTLSDGRFKTNVQEDVPGLEFISQLRPVTYTVEIEKLNKFIGVGYSETDQELIEASSEAIQTGFIAQEVEATAKLLGYNFSGIDTPESEKDHYGIRYSAFTVPLVKAVQELNEQLKEKDARILELEQKVAEIEAIKEALCNAGIEL